MIVNKVGRCSSRAHTLVTRAKGRQMTTQMGLETGCVLWRNVMVMVREVTGPTVAGAARLFIHSPPALPAHAFLGRWLIAIPWHYLGPIHTRC